MLVRMFPVRPLLGPTCNHPAVFRTCQIMLHLLDQLFSACKRHDLRLRLKQLSHRRLRRRDLEAATSGNLEHAVVHAVHFGVVDGVHNNFRAGTCFSFLVLEYSSVLIFLLYWAMQPGRIITSPYLHVVADQRFKHPGTIVMQCPYRSALTSIYG